MNSNKLEFRVALVDYANKGTPGWWDWHGEMFANEADAKALAARTCGETAHVYTQEIFCRETTMVNGAEMGDCVYMVAKKPRNTKKWIAVAKERL